MLLTLLNVRSMGFIFQYVKCTWMKDAHIFVILLLVQVALFIETLAMINGDPVALLKLRSRPPITGLASSYTSIML